MVLFAVAATSTVRAHCQIPCGIYDDQMRIHLMEEHVATIEKSMNEINAKPETNQAVRWVMNKEKHADELSEIVTYYFMAQRIKPGCNDYALKLSQLHEMLVYSMKAKQTTDLANVEKLKELIHSFEHSYMGEGHQH
jgi:nickel superoxide dismutase